MKRWLLCIAAAWAFLALAWWVCGRLMMTDEARVLIRIETLARLVESGNLFALDDAIAADYRDDWDNDRSTLLLAVRALRQRYGDLEIRRGRAVVRVHGDTATADLRARVTGRASGDTQAEGEHGEFQLTFRRVGQEWKLSRVARKEPAP
jgi:hypothetical protein